MEGDCGTLARVVHVVGDGRAGGGTTMVLTLASHLAEQGIDVSVISHKNTFLVDEARRRKLDAIGLDFSNRRNTLWVAARLRRYLSDHRADIVHCHGARAGLPISLIARVGSMRRVYTVHGFHFCHKPAFSRALARWCEKVCIARSDTTVFVSQADQQIARAERLLSGGAHCEVIYNGAEVSSVRERAVEAFDIGYLGRLHRQKNPLILVDILKAMRPARPTLCIIGGGDLEGELRRRMAAEGLKDQIILVGERTHDEALACLEQCRTLVLPSLWEGLPIALIEAMQLGIPVVASDIPGNREVVLQDETGYLVASHDASGYAMRLRNLIENPRLRDALGSEARRRVHLQFSVERHVGRHLDLYRRLMTPVEQID